MPRDSVARARLELQTCLEEKQELEVQLARAREDLSSSRQTVDALRESAEKFQQLADHLTDAFWIRSPDMSEVQYVSPAFERIWGRSVESLKANPHEWADFIVPQDRERVLAAFAGLRGDAPSLDLEYRIARPDGEIRWVRVRGFQVRNGGNELIRHIGIVTDITERHLSEQALRQSEERFRSYFELGLIGMAITSPNKGWLEVNDQACEMFGYSRNELLKMTWAELTHPDDLDADVANFDRVLAGEIDGYSMDKRFLRKGGQVIETTISGRCLRRADGSVDYLVVLMQDVTLRKRLEARLVESQRMETVGKLAGGVAHEFNSILTAIIGQSDLLLRDLPQGSPLAKCASEITAAADRAASLTRQLLAYGRKQFLQPTALDLNEVIARLKGGFQHLVGADVAIRVVAAPDLQAVTADAGQIEQVIMNMAINARDAMPNGGTLTLETANVSLDRESVGGYPELKAGHYVMLAITDTGPGMSPEVAARVFEPFYSTKGIGEGTGLGLSTCYGIVRQSGGHISVYSEPGRGTTFKVFLPQVEHEARTESRRLDAADLPRGTETILLVEDDPALREMAATLLRRLGYTVLPASDGIEALRLKQKSGVGHTDLLFTDVVMPHMSGKELAERVQASFPHTRILFTSAYTESAIVHQGVLDEGVALLQKPFTPSALARKIREVLDRPIAAKPRTESPAPAAVEG